MSNVPRYYFQDIPVHVMDDIMAGMIEGRPEPTRAEVEEWLSADLEQQAEALLAEYC